MPLRRSRGGHVLEEHLARGTHGEETVLVFEDHALGAELCRPARERQLSIIHAHPSHPRVELKDRLSLTPEGENHAVPQVKICPLGWGRSQDVRNRRKLV